MKKGFICSILALIGALVAVIIIGSAKGSGYVENNYSSTAINDTFRVALSAYINEKVPEINVDGEIQNQEVTTETYMNESLQLMFSETGMREAFGCSIDLYDNSYFAIQKGDTIINLYLGAQSLWKEGIEVALECSTLEIDGKIYIPAQVMEAGFGYSYSWDMISKSAKFTRPEGLNDIPAYFNLMDRGKITYVKNQQNMAACWAFASLSAVESTLLPEEYKDFSEDHMINNNGFNLATSDGGDYLMAMSYLTSWRGPVLEADDPYGDGYSNEELTAVNHVQEVRLAEEKDYDSIKKMIFKYGGVESSIYIALLNEYTVDPDFYSIGGSYNYPYESTPNHEIVIIGWDDNYSRYNFMNVPSIDGAFICLNSWGEQFGNNGVFYVSYGDYSIGRQNEVYTKIESATNYDKIYQNELRGWTGRVGYNKPKAYFANVFEAEEEELLKAVSFYSTGPNSSYKVYVDLDPKESSLDISGDVLAEGTLKESGYYTITIDKEVSLKAGQRFAVIVEINTPGGTHPVAMELDENASEKESYISSNGQNWERAQESSKCNICLKAFTNCK